MFSHIASALRLFRSARLVWVPVLAAVLGGTGHAAAAPFDLAGPTLELTVTRGDTTLPASEVPDLAPGDRMWVKAELPPTQSAHYLLVVAFLRGATNPPPQNWFFSCKTWTGKCALDGLTVTVPQERSRRWCFSHPRPAAISGRCGRRARPARRVRAHLAGSRTRPRWIDPG